MVISAVPLWMMHIIIIIGLIIGSIIDLKKREVPDLLNYFLITIGIMFGLVTSIVLWNPWPILSSIGGLIGGYLFGALMFYTGQWGGGDAKMLMGIGAIIGMPIIGPMSIAQGTLPLFATLILSILFAGAVYCMGFMVYLLIKKQKEIKQYLKKPKQKIKFQKYKIILASIITVILAISFIPRLEIIQPTLLIIASMILLGGIAIITSKIIEKVCMIKSIPVNELTEGDWIVKDILVKGKKICGPKDLGITLEQIEELKKHHIKEIVVKEGIPFIPGFLLGYIVIVVFGNWLPIIIKTIL